MALPRGFVLSWAPRPRREDLGLVALFAAGTPDTLDPEDPLAAFEGRAGASLQVFSTADGRLLETYALPSEPAFDGLCAAQGRLYLVTRDGRLLCYGAAEAR